jgi:hypothetical protein
VAAQVRLASVSLRPVRRSGVQEKMGGTTNTIIVGVSVKMSPLAITDVNPQVPDTLV